MDLLTQLKDEAAKARAKANALENAVKALEGVSFDIPLPQPTKPVFVAAQPPVVAHTPPSAGPTHVVDGQQVPVPQSSYLAAKAQRIRMKGKK